MFRQFALTIAFSVGISAFNALTLTPALSAIFLGHHRQRTQGWFFRLFNRAFEAGATLYHRSLHKVLEWKYVALLAFVATLGLAYWLYIRTPQGFIPEEDEGYLMVIVQTPQGASLEYTAAVCTKVEAIASQVPEVDGAFTVVGF